MKIARPKCNLYLIQLMGEVLYKVDVICTQNCYNLYSDMNVFMTKYRIGIFF